MSEALVAEMLAANAAHAESFDPHKLDVPPARQEPIATCPDSRIAVLGVFGLARGMRTIMVACNTRCGVLGHDEQATYLLHTDNVHGFVHDLDTGRLTPVD